MTDELIVIKGNTSELSSLLIGQIQEQLKPKFAGSDPSWNLPNLEQVRDF